MKIHLLPTKFIFPMLLFFLLCFGITAQENRSFDGKGNNLLNPEWGAVGTNQLKLVSNGFEDGISKPAGSNRPSPRVISNSLFHQNGLKKDPNELSDYAWVWGQFIDHDITLSPESPLESLSIPIPAGDPFFDPYGTGSVKIHQLRSVYDPNTGTDENNPRAFPNFITAFIDASGVYGSDTERAAWLRTFVDGKLRTSNGNLLPYNTTTGEYDGPIDASAPEMAMPLPFVTKWFVAGDVRANENPLLTSMHTIFVREHNRLADDYAKSHPTWTDEQIYQHTRKMIGGFIQSVVYDEWLPTLGVKIPTYSEYDENVNPGIFNVFSSAAYRYGHTVINSTILRLDNYGNEIPEGNLLLRDAFFNSSVVGSETGLEPLLKGMSMQAEQDFDTKLVNDLRNFLFGPPGAGGLDLAALNINRGRERGLPDYNTVRRNIGLEPIASCDDMSSKPNENKSVESIYGDINNIDPWVGFLAEDHMANTLFGESVMKIMEMQFTRLRDGDRFYYENDPGLSASEIQEIKDTKLVDIISRNSSVQWLPENIFFIDGHVDAENRMLNGSFNNTSNTKWGAAGTNQLWETTVGFSDGISAPAGEERPNPRYISNEVFNQDIALPDATELSDYAWVWGQFIDHDITLIEDSKDETIHIPVPMGDSYFDPHWTGVVQIEQHRSVHDPATGTGIDNPRSFPNAISAFIDGSGVYGSNIERANWLRTFRGGKLKTSTGNLLPYNTMTGEYSNEIDPLAPEMAMANPFIKKMFVAGDIRANENPLLTSMHTIFVREHNRQCELLAAYYPNWSDEQLYQHARKMVSGLIQAVVYEEWLPSLGVPMEPYFDYDSTANPGILNVFSAAAYRYGHTVINSTLVRLGEDWDTIPQGNILLRDAFFNPPIIVYDGGIEPMLRGMATQMEQEFDCKMVHDLRNFLFGPPGAGGLDLAAMNINRGRDRGLADYNTIRSNFGLPKVDRFMSISKNPWLNQILEQVYGDINNMDPWVGFLAEDHMPNTLFGMTVMTIMEKQFTALRDGDRLYYESDPALSFEEIEEIKNTRLGDIVARNTGITGLQENVFFAHSVVSDVVEVSPPSNLKLYPNPVYESFNVSFDAVESGDGMIQITDMMGREILLEKLNVKAGVNEFGMSLSSGLPAGIYNVNVIFGNSINGEKLFYLTP